jgi:pyruvate dehydrogenase E2 component (dihydrolipoamide acetyltransferase)
MSARSCTSSVIGDREFKVIPLPQLSPSFQTADLEAWHKSEGDYVDMHELIFDVSTDSLTDTDEEVRWMEIESHEEGFLARIFVHGGAENVEPGKPLAIMVEEETDIAVFANMTADQFESSADFTTNGDFLYQAYTKKKPE